MPDAISACSNASLACWKASSGFCTQIADSSTMWPTPAARAASSACRWAGGRPPRRPRRAGARGQARHQRVEALAGEAVTRQRGRRRSTSPKRSVAPASSRAAVVGRQPAPPTPARGRTKHTTSMPARAAARRTVARPMVPVAPRTKTRAAIRSANSFPKSTRGSLTWDCGVAGLPVQDQR
jgi:hypothetical protein